MSIVEISSINLSEVMKLNPKNTPDKEVIDIVNQAKEMLRDEIVRNPNRDKFRVSIKVLEGDKRAIELRDKIWLLAPYEKTGMFLYLQPSSDIGIYKHPELQFYIERER